MKMLTLAAIALWAAPSFAFAQQAGDRVTQLEDASGPVIVTWGQPATLAKAGEYQVRIADFDRNGDNRLTRAEIPRDHALQLEFHVADSNNDHVLTAGELTHWQAP